MDQERLYSLGSVAEMLECKPYRILYLLSTKLVEEPKMRVAGRRLWTLTEISEVAEQMRLQVARQLESTKEES